MLQATHTIGQKEVGLLATRPVRVQTISRLDRPVPPHDHSYYEIMIVRDGAAAHITGAHEQTLSRGSVVVVSPGPAHAIRHTKNLCVTNVYYVAEWFLNDLRLLWDEPGLAPLFFGAHLFGRSAIRSITHFRLAECELEACSRELAELDDALAEACPSPLLLRSVFFKLLLYIARAYHRAEPENAHPKLRPEIVLMLDVVEERLGLGEDFHVGRFAENIGVSPDHFARIFRESMGCTPRKYYQSRRVQRAAAMLLYPRQSVTGVACNLGYCDTAHFSKTFLRHMGISPSEYRRRYLKPPDKSKQIR